MPLKAVNYQPPYTADSLVDYLAGTTLETAVCWKLTPRADSPIAGTVVGATSHTDDLTLPGHPGVTFKSSGGGLPTTVDTESGHESAGLQVESVFDDAAITEEAIEAGDWSGAKFEVYTVNYKALGMGQLVELSAKVGKVETEGGRFVAEARPPTAIAQLKIGRLTSVPCSARLGDGRCKVNLSAAAAGDGGAITVTGSVTTGGSNTEFRDAGRTEADDYFRFGKVRFTSGSLNNRRFEVVSFEHATGRFVLKPEAPEVIPAGTTYEAERGCNHSVEMCHEVYANMPNHRGYPTITNIEEINKIDRAS